MPIVNPMDAFITFQPALDAGEIQLERGRIDRDAYVLFDQPAGEPRFTYVRLEDGIATAMAQIVFAEPFEGKRVAQLGYAVLEHLRGQGRAKDIARAAMTEFTNGVRANGWGEFYFEAMVGIDNPASLAVAQAVMPVEPNDTVDEEADEPALQFMMLVPLSQ